MREKKAASLALEVLIVAVIALLILIVIIAIFAGKIGIFSEGTTKQTEDTQSRVCNANSGMCVAESEQGQRCANGVKTTPSGGWLDCSSTQVCCNR